MNHSIRGFHPEFSRTAISWFFTVEWGTDPVQLTANIVDQVPIPSFSATAACNCLADDTADSASVSVTMPVRS